MFFSSVPEQFAAVGIFLIVDGELQDTAEVERQPAQGEHQNQAEHCLRHLPSLNTHTQTRINHSVEVTDCPDSFGPERTIVKCISLRSRICFHKSKQNHFKFSWIKYGGKKVVTLFITSIEHACESMIYMKIKAIIGPV